MVSIVGLESRTRGRSIFRIELLRIGAKSGNGNRWERTSVTEGRTWWEAKERPGGREEWLIGGRGHGNSQSASKIDLAADRRAGSLYFCQGVGRAKRLSEHNLDGLGP